MKDERVKLGVISNKVFLLLVVDAINSYEKCLQITNREEHITKTDNAIITSTDNVYIISEKVLRLIILLPRLNSNFQWNTKCRILMNTIPLLFEYIY